MSKSILSPIEWLEKYKDKYPNGTVTSRLMEDYAKYYTNALLNWENIPC